MNKEVRKTFGWSAIIFISLIPVFLLFFAGPETTDFAGYSGITQGLGEIAGLVGITMFALTFVLSTRIKWIEDIFGGLDKVYIVHGILGGTALILILSHPIFLVLKYVPTYLPLAATYLLPSLYWAVNFGIIAVLGLIALLFITLFTKVKYHTWKFTHEFLGLVFIFAALHAFLVRGSISKDYIFHGYYLYIAVISAIGILAFSYSLFLKNRLMKNAVYSILKIEHKKDMWTIEMSPEHKPIDYKSGQFIFVRFYNEKLSKEAHPFSIASKSGSKNIRIIVKALGDFTKDLEELKVGDKVSIEGPYGRFNFKNQENKNQVWIAAGIGITPFLGMVEELESSPNFKIELYHTAKDQSELIGYDFLSLLSSKLKSFRYIPWNSKEKGRRIDTKDISQVSGNLKEKDFFLCGPENFKEDMIEQLTNIGIKKSHIHEEAFNFR